MLNRHTLDYQALTRNYLKIMYLQKRLQISGVSVLFRGSQRLNHNSEFNDLMRCNETIIYNIYRAKCEKFLEL